MAERRNWTREELILAFNLYLKLPFGKMHRSNPDIIHLAQLMDRTPSSVSMRLTNFAAVDPFHQARGIKGMTGGIKQVQPIWDEFNQNRDELLFQSEKILAEKEHGTIETKFSQLLESTVLLKGEDKVREVKTRVNQNAFRQIILANYEGKCAVTGINLPQLLVASHIIPWSQNEQERLNPENGICLSATYDRAFDTGLITFDEDYRMVLSKTVKSQVKQPYYGAVWKEKEGQPLAIPVKYLPGKAFLAWHREMVFGGADN